MIAKLIAHGASRAEALDRLAAALDCMIVAGPRTNVSFLAALLRSEGFRAGNIDTGFIERNLGALLPSGIDAPAAALGAARLLDCERKRIAESLDRAPDAPSSPWDAADGFAMSDKRARSIAIVVDGASITANVKYGEEGAAVVVDGMAPALDAQAFDGAEGVHVLRSGRQTIVQWADHSGGDIAHAEGDGIVNAPMHGRVLGLFATAGQEVAKGQRLAVIEAMKMEHTLTAPCAGIVAEVSVTVGAQVADGARVMRIESKEKGAES
jgi:3-methylcrotonyl-CoA carboxylase alpha subunit